MVAYIGTSMTAYIGPNFRLASVTASCCSSIMANAHHSAFQDQLDEKEESQVGSLFIISPPYD